MERQIAFHILGIEETKDEAMIQNAYRGLLKQTNPEDDPEGFKRLREAYEAATVWARTVEAEETREKTEIDLWIDRVDEVYQDIRVRIDEQAWEEVLEDSICEDLDTSLQAREAMMSYLMNHIYLPNKIWRMLDDKFQIVEDKENLVQQFPVDFINYVVYYIQNQEFIEYSMFRVLDEDSLEPEMDTDAYIRNYLGIKRVIDQGQARDSEQIQDCREKLDALQAFGVYHPYEDVEKLRLLGALIDKAREAKEHEENIASTDGWNKAEELIRMLLGNYGEDAYVKLYCGAARWSMGMDEEAAGLWQQILDKYPDHYMAKFYIVRHLMKQEEYAKAKELMMDLLDLDSNDDQVMDFLQVANDKLTDQYTAMMASADYDESKRFEDSMKLAWCHFQNERQPQAIELLKNLTPDEDQAYEYENLYGRVLYRDGQYAEAFPHLKRWLEIILQTQDDGTKENKKRRSRKFRAYHILSGCCHEMGEKDQAIAYVEQAAGAADNEADKISAMQYKAYIYFANKDYELCIDACDQVLKENTQYYPAYLQRQEAAYELKKGQQVVDDYYTAINIYTGYYKPYLLAAQVFFYHDQFSDAKGVIDRARENHVEFSDNMRLYEAKILRNLAEKKEDRDAARVILEELKEAVKNPETDVEDVSEIDYELSLLYWDDDELEEALKLLQSAIDQNGERMQYRMIRGNIFLQKKEYNKALGEYSAAEEAYSHSPALYYNRGRCYKEQGMKELALESFMKTLEYQEGYRDTLELISDYYRERYQEKYDEADYEQALAYMNRQLKYRENCYYYVEVGRIQMSAGRITEAIEAFQKALEIREDDWAAYNNMGCCYKYLTECEKGIECLEKAAELTRESVLPYSNMADCYEIMGQYEKAIECYEKDLQMFPDRKTFYKEIGLLYQALRQYDKALEYYHKAPDLDDYYENVASVYFLQGKERDAVKMLEKGIHQASKDDKADRFSDLAYYYKEYVRDYKKALYYYKKALAAAVNDGQRHEIQWKAAFTCFLMGKKDQAKEYAMDSLKHFQLSERSTEDNYLQYRQYRPARLMRFAWIYICLGETEKGLQMLRDMTTSMRCRHCRHKECFEAYLYLGRYYEGIGEYEKALEYCEKALKINDHEIANMVSVQRLKKILKL